MGWLLVAAVIAGDYALSGTVVGAIIYRKMRGQPDAALCARVLGAVWPLVPLLVILVRKHQQ